MYRISDAQMREAARLLATLGKRGAEPTDDQRRRCRRLARDLGRREREGEGRPGSPAKEGGKRGGSTGV